MTALVTKKTVMMAIKEGHCDIRDVCQVDIHQRPLVDEVTAPVMKKVITKTMQMAGRTMLATLKQIRITRFFRRAVKDS